MASYGALLFRLQRVFFFLNRRQIVESKEKIKQYHEFIKQRAARIPLQYLTKTQGFMGLEFSVTPAVLIPRQDTETLVETLLSYAKDKPGTSLIDVCTGSGCIAVSLAHYGNFAQVTASDISSAALLVAKKMQQTIMHRCSFLRVIYSNRCQGDLI